MQHKTQKTIKGWLYPKTLYIQILLEKLFGPQKQYVFGVQTPSQEVFG